MKKWNYWNYQVLLGNVFYFEILIMKENVTICVQRNSNDSRWVNTNLIDHSNHKMGDSINEFKIKKTLDLVLLQLAQQNQNQIEISIRYTNGARMLSLVQLMNYRITSEENCELFKNCSLNLLQSSFKNFVLGTHQLIRFSHFVQRREDVTTYNLSLQNSTVAGGIS